jgi:ribose/xylose/arabinose/galactoside ABC-type transport system permease subunit
VRPALRALGPLLGLACTWALFALLCGRAFTSWPNQELMLLQTAVVGTAAVGATWIIVSGGIDLSVGSTIALGTMVAALVLRAGGAAWLAALAALASGAAIGALIGTLVKPRAALALHRHARAVGRAARPGQGRGRQQPVYPASLGLDRRADAGRARALAPGVWILLFLSALSAFALERTVFGRHAVALGSNQETARLCGVPVERTRLLVYVLGVACAGVAAVLQLAYLSMGDPTTAQGYELKAIAAAVIGGASLAGGEGSIGGP